MKKICLLALTAFSVSQAFSQDFPGFRSGNYSGVNGVFQNPANVADSRYRFDVNIFSLSTGVGNDQASFKISNLADNFSNDSLKNQIFGKNAGAASGTVTLDFRGPSAMFNIGKDHSFAITTRARLFANVTDIDGKLFDKISDDIHNDPSLPYTISSSEKMRVAVNGWSEFGISYGRVLMEEGPHYLKGGMTLKYLAGAGNSYLNVDNFNGTIDQDIITNDVYLKNTTGKIATGFGGIGISDFEAGDLLSMKSTGFGADLGVVYEYRPDNSKEYLLKAGVALLDLGTIKYERDTERSGAYDINITGSERFSLDNLDGVDFDDLNDVFAAYPQYFTPSAGNADENYVVSLPTTLQLDADYNMSGGFYVNLASQISLSKNDKKAYNNRTYTSVSLTPRFETRQIGVYLPLNYNQLTKFNAGASFRFGPVFFGSGSIISALIGKSKQADLHIGVRISGLK